MSCSAASEDRMVACGENISPLQQGHRKRRRLQAVERRASAEILEGAEIEATLAAHTEWVAAGRPGAVSHEEAMAGLLGQ